MNPKPRYAGFTLIELLVVVAVISVMEAIVTPSLRAKLSDEPGEEQRPRDTSGPEEQVATTAEKLRREPRGILPEFDDARVRLELAASHHRFSLRKKDMGAGGCDLRQTRPPLVGERANGNPLPPMRRTTFSLNWY